MAKNHLLIVCPKCTRVHTRCSRRGDGTFNVQRLQMWRRRGVACLSCVRLARLDTQRERRHIVRRNG